GLPQQRGLHRGSVHADDLLTGPRDSNMPKLRSHHDSHHRIEGGFTILEVLLAFAILTICASALALLGSTTTSGNYRSKDEAAATALAVHKIEQVKGTVWANIDTECVNDSGTLNETAGSGGI